MMMIYLLSLILPTMIKFIVFSRLSHGRIKGPRRKRVSVIICRRIRGKGSKLGWGLLLRETKQYLIETTILFYIQKLYLCLEKRLIIEKYSLFFKFFIIIFNKIHILKPLLFLNSSII